MREPRLEHLYMEAADGGLNTLLTEAIKCTADEEEETRLKIEADETSVIQVLFAIHVYQQELSISHNDLHVDNAVAAATRGPATCQPVASKITE